MSPAARESFFVTCAPGVEPLLHAEVRALKLSKVERQVGGVFFEGTLQDAQRANLYLRTAVRVLMRVARFEAPDDERLYAGARAVEWSRFLAADGRFVVDAHTKDSALDHTLFLEQRVKDAIVDGFRAATGGRPSVDKEHPDLAVHVHLVKDRCTLLVDTSGEPLHKRGWRRYQGRAPLAENLAAALVMFSGWDRRSPLVDPFCGGATILVEAALLARNVAPGLFRREFAFQKLPGYEPAQFARLVADARRAAMSPGNPVGPARSGSSRNSGKLVLLGRDWDPATIAGARENVAAAGLEGAIDLEEGEATDWEPRKGWNAWIVTNPPYGERVGTERGLEDTYRRFGAFLAAHCRGYRLALLTSSPRLAQALAPERLGGLARRELLNGPLQCELLTGVLP